MLQRINWLSISFYFHTDKQLMSVYKDTHTLQRHYIFTDVNDYISFREVPVKLLLRLLQVFFAYTFAPKYTGAYV